MAKRVSRARDIGRRSVWDIRNPLATEWEAVIDTIVATPPFRNALGARTLLLALFHSEYPLSNADLSEVLGVTSDRSVRLVKANLRDKLQEFASSPTGGSQPWRCSYPKDSDELTFAPARSATELFWQPHLEIGTDVPIICSRLTFFLDTATNMRFRFVDVNPDPRADVLDKQRDLYQKHPEFPQKPNFGHSAFYPYVSTAEVYAAGLLMRWFCKRLVERETYVVVSDIGVESEVHAAAPIALGTPEQNRYIGSLGWFGIGAEYLPNKDGVRLWETSEEEMAMLRSMGFDITVDSPATYMAKRMATAIGRWDLVMVRRAPTETDGRRPATVIESGQPEAIRAVARVLVNENMLTQMFSSVSHPLHAPLPDQFEWLCAVDNGGNLRLISQRDLNRGCVSARPVDIRYLG